MYVIFVRLVGICNLLIPKSQGLKSTDRQSIPEMGQVFPCNFKKTNFLAFTRKLLGLIVRYNTQLFVLYCIHSDVQFPLIVGLFIRIDSLNMIIVFYNQILQAYLYVEAS